MVYTNEESVDDDLVESIRVPATDPNAAEGARAQPPPTH
jgi:hypothetical protein